MTDVFDIVREANPIKDIDRYAEVVAGLETQLHPISRREAMIDHKPSVVSLEPLPATPPPRRWWVAAAAAVAVVAALGLGFVLSSNDGDTDEATPATAAASMTPLETVELFLERWTRADVAGAEVLISPAATSRCYDCVDTAVKPWVDHKYRGTDMRTMAIAYVSGQGADYSCSAIDDLVACSVGYETLLGETDAIGFGDSYEWVSTYTVTDGLITHLDLGFYPEITSKSVIDDYADWLAAEYPAEYEDLFYLRTILVNDSEQREAHRRFIAEWAAGR